MAETSQLTLAERKAQLVAECERERQAFASQAPKLESACHWIDLGYKAVNVVGPKLRIAVPAVAMFALSAFPPTRGAMSLGKKAVLAWQVYKRVRSAWQGFRTSKALAAARPVDAIAR